MKEIFNRIKWKRERGYFTFLNRGSAGDVETYTTDAVVEIGQNGVVVEKDGQRRYIPYHRIVEIRLETGEVLLSRRR